MAGGGLRQRLEGGDSFSRYALGNSAASVASRVQMSAEEEERLEKNKNSIQEEVLKICREKNVDLSRDGAAAEVKKVIDEVLERSNVSQLKRKSIADDLLAGMLGLGPLEPLLARPEITEIMVNGPDRVFIEEKGQIKLSDVRFKDEEHLRHIIDRIVQPLGRRIDESSPLVDARLRDGSRVNAVIRPIALDGPSLTIRKFSKEKLGPEDLLKFGSLTRPMLQFLEAAVAGKSNILVSGGTGSGKTTLLNILSNFIPEGERIVTIEDSAELQLSHQNIVRLESRPMSAEGKGEVSIRHLVRNSLRMRPDRIIIGECRGAEALDMLQAMNTGHDGSLSTIHANNPKDCMTRLEWMVTMSGVDMPKVVRSTIGSAIHLVVQQSRLVGGPRKIVEISEMQGYDPNRDVIELVPIFRFIEQGTDENGKAKGFFTATGKKPHLTLARLAARGIHLSLDLFVPVEGYREEG